MPAFACTLKHPSREGDPVLLPSKNPAGHGAFQRSSRAPVIVSGVLIVFTDVTQIGTFGETLDSPLDQGKKSASSCVRGAGRVWSIEIEIEIETCSGQHALHQGALT